MDEPVQENQPQKEWSSFLQSFSLKQYLLVFVLAMLFINVMILNFKFFASPQVKTKDLRLLPSPSPLVSQGVVLPPCDSLCTEQINQATEAVKLQLVKYFLSITPSPPVTQSPTPTVSPTPSAGGAHEFFVPLGQGSAGPSDWTAYPTIGATIDPANYGDITKVTFEASVRIPTGNQTVYLRLYNATTYQTVANSEMTLEGGTPKLLISSPITLASGSNSYQLQLKTQLGYATYIDFARIRIQTK